MNGNRPILIVAGAALLAASVAHARSTPVTVVNDATSPVPVTGSLAGAVSPDLGAMTPVTFSQRVNPDNTVEDRSGDSTATLRMCIGQAGCLTGSPGDAALSDRIRDGSGEVLVITGIYAYNFAVDPPPADGYGLLNFGACRSGVFPRNFGVPIFTVAGRATMSLTFQPGAIVGDLAADERLCFTSYEQSDQLVDVTVHGYLTARP